VKLELAHIRKRFGQVQAVDDIDLVVEPGSIHGILGENGAGKSTLMKIACGFLSRDNGEIRVDGRPLKIGSTAEAVRAGIGMLHQDPLDIPRMSVLDNFLLGAAHGNRRQAAAALSARGSELGFALDPAERVSRLSVGERQQLEIVRLLWLGVRVLILDEPTTAISADQRTRLFSALRALAASGRAVLLVTHKLEEVQALCQRVTVLARGRVAGQLELPAPGDQLVRLMFGQPLEPPVRPAPPSGEIRVEIDSLELADVRLRLPPLSLSIRQGEIVGLAGLEGSGQQLLLRGLSGLLSPLAGQLRLDGEELAGRSYARFLSAGIAFLPANRLEQGVIPGLSLTDHFSLTSPERPFWIPRARMEERTAERIRSFQIKGQGQTLAGELSGGNQQRLMLALLAPRLRLLLLEHPTRGLDLDSTQVIWRHLKERAQAGTAMVFASADLEELVLHSHRILVFFSGRLVGEVDPRGPEVQRLGEMIGGRGLGRPEA